MKLLPVYKGLTTVVDDDVYPWLTEYSWRSTPSGHVYSSAHVAGKTYSLWIHRLVTNAPDDYEVDHIDCDPFNNQISNLRFVTPSQNLFRKAVRKDNSSGYKGVCWKKRTRKWVSRIQVDGIRKEIGYFDSAIDAAKAYNEVAFKCMGEFAYLNPIPE